MKTAIIGGGAGGLVTALLLARDGHDVTLLERDPQPPPDNASTAWSSWERKGVTQFRQPHGLLAGLCTMLANELPDVWQELEAADPLDLELVDRSPAPDEASATLRERLRVRVMRRSTFERVIAVAAANEPNLAVHRGVAVQSLRSTSNGSLRITGVQTDELGDLAVDLVIDSAGRRTPVAGWLEDMGVGTETWSESDGFTYFSRWYRTRDGEHRPLPAGLFGGLAPGLVALIFPGENGVFGIAMVGLGQDKALRRLRDPDTFTSVTAAMPTLAAWVDPDVAEPITDVMPMGAIQNRSLRFWHDGRPSVEGLVNVGDSVMSSNPSLGRGIGLAALMGQTLRDQLRSSGDPTRLAVEFDEIKQNRFLPFLADAVQSDTDTRRMFEIATGRLSPDTPTSDRAALVGASFIDMESWKRWNDVNQLFETPTTCFDDADLIAQAHEHAAQLPPNTFSLSRDELEAKLSGESE